MATGQLSIASNDPNSPKVVSLTATPILLSFAAQPDDDVYDAFQQADGKILISGIFLNVGGLAQPYVARLNANGIVDATFTPTVNAVVFKVRELADGKILLAGNFSTVNGDSQDRITVLNSDGTRDSSFNASVTGTPNDIAEEADGNLLFSRYDGGGFATVNGGAWTNTLVRLSRSGVHDTTFGSGLTYSVTGLGVGIRAISNGNIYILRHGSSSSTWGSRKGMARLNTTTGAVDATFDAGLGSASGGQLAGVKDLVEDPDGSIWIAGQFYSIGAGTTRHFVAHVNANTGAEVGSFNVDFSGVGFGTTFVQWIGLRSDGYLVMAGRIFEVNGETRWGVAAVNTTNGNLHPDWPDLAPSIDIQAPGRMIILSPSNYTLIGEQDSFTIAGSTRNAIAVLDPDGALVSLS